MRFKYEVIGMTDKREIIRGEIEFSDGRDCYIIGEKLQCYDLTDQPSVGVEVARLGNIAVNFVVPYTEEAWEKFKKFYLRRSKLNKKIFKIENNIENTIRKLKNEDIKNIRKSIREGNKNDKNKNS